MKFIDVDLSKLDSKKDELLIKHYNNKIDGINEGLEDNENLLTLLEDFDNMLVGIEEYSIKLPKYINAYDIISNNLIKLSEYQAGIEDDIDMENTISEITFVTKSLNIKVEEIDHGLLDDDKDDDRNTNIIIKIIKKIFNFIVGLIKGIVGLIVKIIKTFFRFIKRILGIGDPAIEIKKELEKEAPRRSSYRGGGIYVPSYTGGSGNTVISKTNNKIKAASATSTSTSSTTSTKDGDSNTTKTTTPTKTGDNATKATDTTPKPAGTGPVVKETIDKKPSVKEAIKVINGIEKTEEKKFKNVTFKVDEDKLNTLKDIVNKIENEYPLAVMLANTVFELDKGKLDVFLVLTILYALTGSVASANIDCSSRDGIYSIERHINEFLINIKDIHSIMDDFTNKIEKRMKELDKIEEYPREDPYARSYFASAIWFKLADMVNKLAPIYDYEKDSDGRKDRTLTVLGTTRRFMNSMSVTIRNANGKFNAKLNMIKQFLKNDFNKVDFVDIIYPIIKEKLGKDFYDSLTEYIPTNNASNGTIELYKEQIRNSIDNSGYKYFKSAVLTFDRKEIQILIHLTNISNINNIHEIANLPEPGEHMHGAAKSTEVIKKYRYFFKNILPQIVEDIKGKFIVVKIEITKADLMNKFDLLEFKDINTNPLVGDINKIAMAKLMDALSKGLDGDVDTLETCLKATEKSINKAGDLIKDLEDKFNDFLHFLTVNKAFINGPMNRTIFKEQARDIKGKKDIREGLDNKIITVEVIRDSLVMISKSLQTTSNEILNIFKNDVLENLKLIKNLSTDKAISTYINDLLNINFIEDGIGG